MPGKYAPLARHLRGQSAPVSMSFSQLENLLGDSLPPSARRHQAWWSNESEGSHVQAHAWLDTGWRVASVDLRAERVVFEPAEG